MDKRDQLAPINPYFEHADVQLWLAKNANDQVVGRISAQIDHLGPEDSRGKVGCFGMFECINDRHVAYQLLTTAQNWLAAKGCSIAQGPFNLSINQESGLLVEGFDTPPYLMMGHALPHYPKLIEYAGFRKVKDLYAWEIIPDFEHPPAIAALVKKYAGRVKIRPINKRDIDRELDLFAEIFNDAWSENWGFIPFSLKEFKKIGKEILLLVAPEWLRVAELDGEVAGMIVMLPNFNQIIADLHGKLFPTGLLKLLWRVKFSPPTTARVALMGVKRKYQNSLAGSALAFLLIVSLQPVALGNGIKKVEMSWVLEDNDRLNKILSSIGGVRYKTYRVYEKLLKSQSV